MHAEIKKFWKETGYELYGPSAINTWELYVGSGPFYRIETVCHGNKYHFNGEWYSEDEMLRIVRMKAFI